MESLFLKHDKFCQSTSTEFIRRIYDNIDWDARQMAIVGPKGVGKSTLIKQYIKLNYPRHSNKVLYCSLDSLYFSNHSITELVEKFVMQGGEHLFLDEVHKYSGPWSIELKEIYDLYPELRIVISGSSAIKILDSEADLSRRCVIYNLQGLSFREYLRFRTGLDFPCANIEDILEHPHDLADVVNDKCKPIEFFKDYIETGYYPFYLEGMKSYGTKIEQSVAYTMEVEMTELKLVDISGVRKLKKLMNIISDQVPFELDASKLAKSVEATRETVVLYLHNMAKAKLLNLLFSGSKNYAKLAKPDKLYLENPNMLYALCSHKPEIGTVRETFAVNQLSENNIVEYGKERGDFKVNGKYMLEVGGAEKSFTQIAGVENSFVLADDIDRPSGRRIPLWMLGLLY